MATIFDGDSAARSRPADDVDLRFWALVASLLPDEPTLQFGPGGIGEGIARAIDRPVRIWSGLVTESIAALHDRGLLLDPVVAAYAWGGEPIGRLVAANMLTLTSATVTPDISRLSAIPRFVGCNTAVQVGLDGAVNVESVGTRTIAGVGGHVDFCAGASRSVGGMSITAVRSRRSPDERRHRLRATRHTAERVRLLRTIPATTSRVQRPDSEEVVPAAGCAGFDHVRGHLPLGLRAEQPQLLRGGDTPTGGGKPMTEDVGDDPQLGFLTDWAVGGGLGANVASGTDQLRVGVTDFGPTEPTEPHLVDEHSTCKSMIDDPAALLPAPERAGSETHPDRVAIRQTVGCDNEHCYLIRTRHTRRPPAPVVR